jgi:hypothetical protein
MEKVKMTRDKFKIRGLLALFILLGCTSPEITIEDTAKRAALLAARPVLEKIFNAEAPLAPSNRELFPIVQNLPGGPFNPREYFENRQNFSDGVVELLPGDYQIPVMSYCMKSSGSSPTAHRYRLGRLSGRATNIIRALNIRALSKYRPDEIQVALWNIQNGVSFEEMPPESKKIISDVIPEYRKDLEKSFFQDFQEKWDGVAVKIGLPRFDEVTDQALSSLGEFGEAIRSLKEFKRSLRESGGNYENLNSLISLPGISETTGTEATTHWSQISENVYARFLTAGHYLNVGGLQIRVVAATRFPQATQALDSSKIDIAGLVADPGSGGVQPLLFGPMQGSVAIPFLAAADPPVIAAFLAALIVAEYTDWQAVGKALEQWGASTQQEIQSLVDKLRKMYAKEFGPKPGQVVPPPAVPGAFPNLKPVRRKTDRPGGGKRFRWKDEDGNIYEWDYQHGRLEKYDRRGIHQGEYDPNTGQQTKPRNPKYRVEP